MSGSDAEDEKFVRNVISELSAFHSTDLPSTNTGLENEQISKETKAENGVSEEVPAGSNSEFSDQNQTNQNVANPEPATARQPSRIIRLSRPTNPYSMSRTLPTTSLASVASEASNVSSTHSLLSSTTALSTTSSSILGSAAPGSRLAALQRPGSPMHRILQRSNSPALAAAASILNRQSVAEHTNGGESSNNGAIVNRNDNNTYSKDIVSKIVNGSSDGTSKTVLFEDTSKSDAETAEAEGSAPPAVPPRIQSAKLTSSILLRRPQSPLNTGRHAQLLNKPNSSQSFDSNGPLSPSNGEQDALKPTSNADESLVSERVAIKNKLRNNSFRLKDLLNKRPFAKARDGESEGSEEQAASGPDSENLKDAVTTETGVGKMTSDCPDRTRWRREGISSLQRSKSTVSDRPPTLISSGILRPRTLNRVGNTSADMNSEFSNIDDRIAKNGLEQTVHNNANTKGNESVKVDERLGSPDGINDVPSSRVTLLRSPRTRQIVSNNTVPCLSPTKESTTCDTDIKSDNYDHMKSEQDQNDRKAKVLTDLEKENEVNLVFDSQTIGQQDAELSDAQNTNKVEVKSNRKSIYTRSQSEFTKAVQSPTELAEIKMHSEPATPQKENHSIPSSQSYENNPDLEFANSSPALKRSLVVTDLDQAMKDRDYQKLASIFRDRDVEVRKPSDKLENQTKGFSHDDDRETDLDAQRVLPLSRLRGSPMVHARLQASGDSTIPTHQAPHPSPPVNPVAPMVYKPHINLEDAVKWPMELPGKLDVRKMDVFEGQMLLNWLSGSIDKAHYLRLVMTQHDINVIVCQVCTCLIAAGIMRQIEAKEQEHVFKTDCMYYWTHTQTSAQSPVHDVSKMTPMWPPTQDQVAETKPGLKYTEADHQAAMVTLRHEYREQVDSIQADHKGVLDRAREEYETRLQHAVERIALLTREVEKYKQLAGIEKFTQNALSDAEKAQKESGLLFDGVHSNGHVTPNSQYHTPAGTPGEAHYGGHLNSIRPHSDVLGDLSLDGTSGSETSSLGGVSIGSGSVGDYVIPPPPPPPPPGIIPPPPPPPSQMNNNRRASKPVVHPKSQMKALFWERIQVQELKSQKHKQYADKRLVWDEVEELNIDITELDTLFSKTNIEPSRRFFSNKPKNQAAEVAKVINAKRSQTVGIFLSSLRIDMSDIEHAILTFDTEVLGEDKLRQIYEIRGEQEELKKLREYVKKHPDTPLDKPDQFVYDLSLIPDYAERIFCFIFRETFQESIAVIETKMTNLRMTCKTLMESTSLKKILGLVLALGNYMNGGSKSRGQADGFGIEILPKLKDVRSKDQATSLLHYVVVQYIKKFEKGLAGTDKVKYPLPDPGDLKQACLVNFDELEKELTRIKADFNAAEERADKVIKSAKEHVHLQPFKDIMTEFFEQGRKEFEEQQENLAEGKSLFQETVIFFCAKPEGGKKEVTPDYFFEKFETFCQDFKDTWKREQQRIVKIRIRENEIRVKQMQERLAKQPVRTRTRTRGGLKDRLAKQGLLES
ncbi:uncharacterized protein LOC127834445 isoform X2 [Dreissena polymorpha]|uniref:uncharacterized protein LOC127834445 isoform X2 n=1 Tax=Dreissena polymorpha TaxID=45954 RepID=UPI0022640977|nr:uncharacterized protein LOC127834445 isoform X2 [Dreissena polymorpha]